MSATYDSDRLRPAAAFAQRSATLLVCCALVVACSNAAEAQCSAQDVLRNHLALKGAPPPATSGLHSAPPPRFLSGRGLLSEPLGIWRLFGAR